MSDLGAYDEGILFVNECGSHSKKHGTHVRKVTSCSGYLLSRSAKSAPRPERNSYT